MKFINALLDFFSTLNRKTAAVACLLCLPLIGVMAYEVVARYVFLKPTSWAYDLTWMLYGALVFLGGGYTLLEGSHVRVDVVYSRFPDRIKALVEVICHIILFFPITFILVRYSYMLAQKAWVLGERSPFALWKPLTGPIKTVMFIGLVLLLLQGIVEFSKHLRILVKGGSYDS